MDFSGLLGGIISNAIWWIVLLGGAAMVAWLKLKAPKYAAAVGYGLATAACLAILAFVITGHSLLYSGVTKSNAETTLRTWVDDLQLGIEKREEMAGFDYCYALHLSEGKVVSVGRETKYPDELQFFSRVEFTPEEQSLMSKLTPLQRQMVVDELSLELGKLGVPFEISHFPSQTNYAVTITRGVSLVDTHFTEGEFEKYLHEQSAAILVAQAAIRLIVAQQPILAGGAH